MKRIVIEIDFTQSKTQVALKFKERDEDGEDWALRMQALFNLASRIKKGLEKDLPEQDRSILFEILPHVAKPGTLKTNLLILMISRPEFQRIIKKYEKHDVIFIESESGLAYSSQLTEIELHFELKIEADNTRLSAIVPLNEQTSKSWSQVSKCIVNDELEARIDGQLYKLNLPVDRALLDKVFGNHNPSVPTKAVPEHLPTLINHRLDLLKGPSVRHEKKNTKALVKLKSEGADILLSALIGNAKLRLSQKTPLASLHLIDNCFVVRSNRSKDFKHLLTFLKSLNIKENAKGEYKIEGDSVAIKKLLEAIKTLPKQIKLEYDDQLKMLFAGDLKLNTAVRAQHGHGWFQLNADCYLGDQFIPTKELIRVADKAESGIIRLRSGQWIAVDETDLQETSSWLKDLGLSNPGRKSQIGAKAAFDKLSANPNCQFQKSAKELAESVIEQDNLPVLSLPKSLNDILRDYQKTGVDFLYERAICQVGSLLADDMGLGKTLQVLSTLTALKNAGRLEEKALIVCPASVVAVWQKQSNDFSLGFNIELLTGNAKARKKALNGNADIVVCSYGILRIDIDELSREQFSIVILDEAQQIKNPDAKVTQAAKSIHAEMRLAMSGTPLENKLTDLWSIMDFLNPGLLYSEQEFNEVYGPKSWRRKELPRRIEPIMLRRTKEMVAKELPDKIEENMIVPATAEEQQFYQAQLSKAREQASGGNASIFAALTRLRMASCHPKLVDEHSQVSSAKFNRTLDLVDELISEGNSVLLFSQFTSMLKLFEEALNERQIKQYKITGETSVPKRQTLVDDFQSDDEASVFLLSLRAAGTGLTLTKASYVFIYDPWWNPAVENQAIDRTHRIGQKNTVFAYRVVTEHSVEEKVLQLQEEKRQLFDEVINEAESSSAMSMKELADFLLFQ